MRTVAWLEATSAPMVALKEKLDSSATRYSMKYGRSRLMMRNRSEAFQFILHGAEEWIGLGRLAPLFEPRG